MPLTILVVDDELDDGIGFRRDHVRHAAPDFYDVVADTTSPGFAELGEIVRNIPGALRHMEDDESAARYFASDDAVQEVLLHPAFAERASETMRQLVEPFFGRVKRARALKAIFVQAFQGPEFVVEFIGAPRPDSARVLSASAVFLDLVLEEASPASIDDMKNYLRALSEAVPDSALPPIVLMSINTELNEHRKSFSEFSQISAAGLLVLPKQRITKPEFGASGLRLSFDQLVQQSAAAHAIRVFIRSWMDALKRAAEQTATTLWNLDAPAMQQIHFASYSDGDAYEEHLSELLSREHLYRVEADADVVANLSELDAKFREQLSLDRKTIENRFIAPITQVETSRALVSHFTWFGARPTLSFLAGDEKECARSMGRSLPFGAVLCGPTIATESQALVHITQQCDINSLARDADSDTTLFFAVAKAREILTSDSPLHDTKQLILRNLQLQEDGACREFDFHVVVEKMLAMPLRAFLTYAREQELRVIGRLRSDIANQIVAATTSHMSRPASQKMLRSGLLRSKVYLQHRRPGGSRFVSDEDGQPKIFSLTLDDRLYSFQDDACVEIALWLVARLAEKGIEADPKTLCTKLRCGWKHDQPIVAGVLDGRVRDSSALDDADAVNALIAGDAAGPTTRLIVVRELARSSSL